MWSADFLATPVAARSLSALTPRTSPDGVLDDVAPVVSPTTALALLVDAAGCAAAVLLCGRPDRKNPTAAMIIAATAIPLSRERDGICTAKDRIRRDRGATRATGSSC